MNVNRLRTRLILSYLAVVIVTIAVTGVLLVVLLRARPVAAEPIFARLETLARTVGQRENALNLLLNLPRQGRLDQVLNAVASRTRARIVVLTAERAVAYDSMGALTDGAMLDLRPWGASTGPPGQPDAPPLARGSFQDAGEEWLYVLQEAAGRSVTWLLLVAQSRPPSSWREVLNLFGTSLLLPLGEAGLIGLAVAILLAGISSRGLVRALGRLGSVAKGVAAGSYHERAPLQGPDEVRAVAAAFNHMAEQVQAAQIAQQDFLANVSHDLRTPLTSIQGFSQAIIDGTSQDPAYHARIIYDEAGRLSRMVGELLDLARLSTGRLSMRQGRVNVAQIADAVAERLSIRAREGGVQLVRDIQEAPDIAGDGDRLAQVLTNLVDNALAFTPRGGTVRIGTRAAAGGAEIAVSDTGQGIPPEDLPRIFERFYQVDKSRGPRRGSGLGLAITAEIVQAHGGRIEAHSGGIGQGATFTVWFPALDMSTVTRRR